MESMNFRVICVIFYFYFFEILCISLNDIMLLFLIYCLQYRFYSVTTCTHVAIEIHISQHLK